LSILTFCNRFEVVKRVHVSLNPFSIEDNTLTPTLKLRRKDAFAKYATELQALYALGEPNSDSSKL
jgi:long-chain acyl-CoA synthetase